MGTQTPAPVMGDQDGFSGFIRLTYEQKMVAITLGSQMPSGQLQTFVVVEIPVLPQFFLQRPGQRGKIFATSSAKMGYYISYIQDCFRCHETLIGQHD